MSKPGNTGLKRIIKAFGYSWQGLKALCKHEAAFRQELVLAVILIPLAFYLGRSPLETAILIIPIFIILIAEMLNSAIEAVVDRIGEEKHELAGRAKDIGSMTVLTAFILLLTTWGIILIGRLN